MDFNLAATRNQVAGHAKVHIYSRISDDAKAPPGVPHARRYYPG